MSLEELAVKIVDVRERDEHGVCVVLSLAEPCFSVSSPDCVANLRRPGNGQVSKSRDRVTRTEVDLWTKVGHQDMGAVGIPHQQKFVIVLGST